MKGSRKVAAHNKKKRKPEVNHESTDEECTVSGGNDSSTSKHARADALMSRLTAKLHSSTDPKKRLALQAKMLRLLPKCSPVQKPEVAEHPAPKSPPTTATQMAATAAAAGGAAGARPGVPAGFTFKQQQAPRAAVIPPARALTGPEEQAQRQLRQQRFGEAAVVGELDRKGEPDGAASVLALSGGFGTCADLEKDYLRLTRLPRVEEVRPPAVLAAALRRVKAKWLQSPDYPAASEQLKAIRQDLTVQHVRDELTVDVYETHGRLALEANDLAEFRRCHGVLRQLYSEGVSGESWSGNAAEFEAYGLLYTQATAAARNTLSLELARVPAPLLSHPFVRHAMEVCSAARSGNYANFISLYEGAPRMSPYIMDRLVGQMRLLALLSVVAAHRPLAVGLTYLAETLGLETEGEASEFAQQQGAVVDTASGTLDTRASAAQALGPHRPQ